MPKAYVIAQLDIQDLDAYEKYARPAIETVRAFDGEVVIARTGRRCMLEGTETMPQIIMVQFPSYERALEWYNSEDYSRLTKLRRRAATSTIFAIEGAG